MNTTESSITGREHESILQTYKRLPIVIDHARGCSVFAADGTEYIDFLGGIAVNTLGHSHPRIIEAINRQASRYLHVSNYFYQDVQVELAERIVRHVGYGKVFFSNSGAEATEGALKFARLWGNKHGRDTVVGFTGGFHGRTYGALSIMDKPRYKDGMGPFLSGTAVLPYNDAAALLAAPAPAAVMVECIQGEGGVSSLTAEFAEALRQVQRDGALLIADEVQAGAGRTGAFCSYEHFGLRPDVVVMAKGIGGGLPLGALVVAEHIQELMQPGMHGTTFGGNALSCAAGIAVIDELEAGLMEHVRSVDRQLRSTLEAVAAEFPEIVLEVRGKGCMMGLALAIPSAPIVEALLRHRIIANATSDTVIRLVPPLVVGDREVDMLAAALRATFSEHGRPVEA